jgi:hypothetical protein
MDPLADRLVQEASRALADRWGHRVDPPSQILEEDARVAVYAVLRSLANNAVDVNEDHQLVLIAWELDRAADALDHERFLPRGEKFRLPWKELRNWAKFKRQAREADREQDIRRREAARRAGGKR